MCISLNNIWSIQEKLAEVTKKFISLEVDSATLAERAKSKKDDLEDVLARFSKQAAWGLEFWNRHIDSREEFLKEANNVHVIPSTAKQAEWKANYSRREKKYASEEKALISSEKHNREELVELQQRMADNV